MKDKYLDKRFDILTEENIDLDILETMDFSYSDSLNDTIITVKTQEFTSVCPWTGLPDTAELSITYIPSKKLVEMKSLKYYILSFRNVGILQEHAVNRILCDLSNLLQPKSMEVEARFESRGGLDTVVKTTYRKNKKR